MSGPVNAALLVRVQAQPGKEDEVRQFLRDGVATVNEERGTVAWFAVQFGPSSFGIFDAFPDDEARQAHLGGRLGAALMARAEELFTQPPDVEPVDVIAHKLP
jgi:quinol monooxygenase YgiN